MYFVVSFCSAVEHDEAVFVIGNDAESVKFVDLVHCSVLVVVVVKEESELLSSTLYGYVLKDTVLDTF